MARRVIFSDEARANIHAIDRETAMRLLDGLARFLKSSQIAATSNNCTVSIRQSAAFGSVTGGSYSARASETQLRSCAFGTAAKPIDNPLDLIRVHHAFIGG